MARWLKQGKTVEQRAEPARSRRVDRPGLRRVERVAEVVEARVYG